MYFTSRKDLDTLLQVADTYHAADVHLGPGRPPMLRGHGELFPIKEYTKELTAADMDMLLEFASRTPTGPSTVQSLEDMDFAYIPAMSTSVDSDIPSVYRVNAGMTIEGIRMVFRRLPALPPTIHDIQAPDPYVNILNTQRQGLVLVTGPTGSGKSTTLAAGIRHLIESNFSLHIITLENPVEYRYTGLNQDKVYVTQREIGRSLKDFKTGIRSALRQDPDIILVGELRDLETMKLALEAAETGHLVFATVHTTDVASSISRIVQTFPKEEQTAARVQLLSSLRFIISQRLVPKVTSGRVAAREYLEFTPSLRQELLELDPARLYNRLISETALSGQTMLQAVTKLLHANLISKEEHRAWELMLQEESHTQSQQGS